MSRNRYRVTYQHGPRKEERTETITAESEEGARGWIEQNRGGVVLGSIEVEEATKSRNRDPTRWL